MKIEDLGKIKVNQKVIDDSIDALYDYLTEKNLYSLNISHYITDANKNLKHILAGIYSEDIYSNMKRASNDPQVISFVNQNLGGQEHIFNFDKFIDVLLDEYLAMNSEFKTSKGSDSAIKYAYNLTSNSDIQPALTDNTFKITWGTPTNPKQPFYLQIEGFLLPFIYDAVVKEMAHPVGFGYDYYKSLLLDWIDYPTSDLEDVWGKVEIRGIVDGEEKIITIFQKATGDKPQIGMPPIYFQDIVHQDGVREKILKFIGDDGQPKYLHAKNKPRPSITIYDENNEVIHTFDDAFQLFTDYEVKIIFRVKDYFDLTNIYGVPMIDVVPRPFNQTFQQIGGTTRGVRAKIGEGKIGSKSSFGTNRPHPMANYDDFKAITYRDGFIVPNRDKALVCLDRQDAITLYKNNINDNFNNKFLDSKPYYNNFKTAGSRREPIYHFTKTDFRIGRAGGELVNRNANKGEANAEMWDVVGLDIEKGVYHALNKEQVIKTAGTPYARRGAVCLKFELEYEDFSGTGVTNIAEIRQGNEILLSVSVYYNGKAMRLYVDNITTMEIKPSTTFYVKKVFGSGDIEIYCDGEWHYLKSDKFKPNNWELVITPTNLTKFKPRNNWQLRKLVEDLFIYLKDIDTSLVTDFSRVFEDTQSYRLYRTDYNGCETWETRQVTTLNSLCKGNSKFNQDIGGWNVSNVRDMTAVFRDAPKFDKSLARWDTRNVEIMDSMFEIGKAYQPRDNRELRKLVEDLSIHLGDIDTMLVTDFSRVFEDTPDYPLDRTDYDGCENWTTGQVTNLSRLCYGNNKFNHSINSWDTSNVTNMDSAFMNAQYFDQPLDNWVTSNVTNMDYVFQYKKKYEPRNNKKLRELVEDLSVYLGDIDTSLVDDFSRIFEDTPNYKLNRTDYRGCEHWITRQVKSIARLCYQNTKFNHNIGSWDTSNVENMDNAFDGATAFNNGDGGMSFFSLLRSNMRPSNNRELRTLIEDPNVNLGDIDTSLVTDFSGIFAGNLERRSYAGCENWTTSQVNDMSSLCRDNARFNHNINSWDVSKVTNFTSAFNNAISFNQPLNNWRTSSANYMDSMFDIVKYQPKNNAELRKLVENTEIHLGLIDTSLVTDFSRIFEDSISYPLHRTDYDGCETWTTSQVTNMFSLCLGNSRFNQNIGSWNVSNVTNMNSAFKNARNFNQSLANWNTRSCTNMDSMFEMDKERKYKPKDNAELRKLVEDLSINLDDIDTSLVTDFSRVFEDTPDYPLDRTDYSGCENWTTRQVTNLTQLCYCNTKFNHNINSWDVSNVRLLTSAFNTAKNFNQPLDKWDTRNVTNMDYVFDTMKKYRPKNNCELRQLVEDLSINLGDIDTSLVTDFSRVFEDTPYYRLDRTDYSGCETWATSQVTNLNSLCKQNDKFNHNINSWDVSNVVTMHSAFKNATNFNQSLANWNTSNVTNMDYVFEIGDREVGRKFVGVELYDYPVPNRAIELDTLGGNKLDVHNNLFHFDKIDNNQMLLGENGSNFIEGNGATIISCFENFEFDKENNHLELNYFNIKTKNDGFISCDLYNEKAQPVLRFRIMSGGTKVDEKITIRTAKLSKVIFTFELKGNQVIPVLYMQTKRECCCFKQTFKPVDYVDIDTVFRANMPYNNISVGLREFIVHNKFLAVEYDAVGIFKKSDYPMVYQKTQMNYFVRDNMGYAFYEDKFDVDLKREIIVVADRTSADCGTRVRVTMTKPSDSRRLKGLSVTTNDPSRYWLTQISTNVWEIYDIGVTTADCQVIFNTSYPDTEPVRCNIRFNATHIKYRPKNLAELKTLVNNYSINLCDIDVILVKSFENLFSNATNRNFSGIDCWNTVNVTNMYGCFRNCSSFNENITGWNVSNVTNMDYMFYGCRSFNRAIGGWNVSRVTSMNSTFKYASSFNQYLGNWNVSRVTNMDYMFEQ